MTTPEQARKLADNMEFGVGGQCDADDQEIIKSAHALRDLARQVEELQADAQVVRDSIPNLQPVIDWLENGCTLAAVIEELRLYQATIEHIKRAK